METEHKGPYSSDTSAALRSELVWVRTDGHLFELRTSTFIHPIDTGDKGVSNAVSLECLKQVVVGDPIESIFKTMGKHA